MCSAYHFFLNIAVQWEIFSFWEDVDIIAHFPTLHDNPQCYKYLASSCRRNLIE